jgi:hypothetical protein
MKSLLACLLLFPALAQADTPVTLYGEPCANIGWCMDVQNDGGLTINYLQLACGANCVAIDIAEMRYSSGLDAVYPVFHDGIYSFENAVLYAEDGSYVTLSADYTKTRKHCGKYWCTGWALLDGVVVLPCSRRSWPRG